MRSACLARKFHPVVAIAVVVLVAATAVAVEVVVTGWS